MEVPHGVELPVQQPLPARLLRALAALDASSKLALVCVIFGWFFMNTLVATLGSLEHGVRFWDLSAVIADPTRLFFGGDTPVHRFLFGMLCIACLAGPLAPSLLGTRSAAYGYLAPLALLMVGAGLLYFRTSGDLLTPPADTKSITGSIVHFANDLVHRGSDVVARHIAIGAGSYLALIGSVVLAVQGVRRLRS